MKTPVCLLLALLLGGTAFASDIPRQPKKMRSPRVRAVSTDSAPPKRIAPDTASWGNLQFTNDAADDVEPVIIRGPRSNPQGVGIDTTMSAYMKRFAVDKYRVHALLTEGDTDVPPPGPLAIPAGYTSSGDPIAGMNPYTTGTNPRTFYVSGTAQQYDAQNHFTTNGIFVWSLRDGEITWQRSTIATVSDGSYLDKPWMTVSWYPADLGWTWVTYVKVPPSGDPKTIYLHRSTDGVNYSQVPATFTGNGYHAPVVLVDSSTGRVYLLWVSYPENKIYLAYTTNGGVSFSTPQSFDAGNFTEPMLGPGIDLVCDSSDVCVLARSMLNARYNSVDHSIGVVWHRREPIQPGGFINKTKTDVFFNSYSTQTQEWRGVHKVNAATSTNDQWNGALDYDDTGEYVVSWYDRRDDPNNRKYAVYATRINPSGARIDYYDTALTGARGYGSDPTVYQPQPNGYILLGEYHDLWSWYDPVNSRWIWHSADINIPWPYTKGDVWDDQIQP